MIVDELQAIKLNKIRNQLTGTRATYGLKSFVFEPTNECHNQIADFSRPSRTITLTGMALRDGGLGGTRLRNGIQTRLVIQLIYNST